MNQSTRMSRITVASKRNCIERHGSFALKLVRSWTIESLLFFKSTNDKMSGIPPLFVEYRSVACCFPVAMCKSYGIAERINFVFSLVQFLLHCCQVFFPFAASRSEIKCICIRIDQDASRL